MFASRSMFVVSAALIGLSSTASGQVVIDFDDVPGVVCPCFNGTPVPEASLIDDEYLDQGVLFDSGGGGVAIGAGSNPVSAPHVASPTSPGPVWDFFEDVQAGFWIDGQPAIVDDVSISITNTSSTTTLTASDLAGDILGASTASFPESPSVSFPGQIHRVVLSSAGQFAFDDFTFDGLKEAECFLVIGNGPGRSPLLLDVHQWETHVDQVQAHYAVLLDDLPEFVLPLGVSTSWAAHGGPGASPSTSPTPDWLLDGTFTVQIVMWNPGAFPGQPEQWTTGLAVQLLPGGQLVTRPYGDSQGGLDLWVETDVDAQGRPVIRFPFSLEGF